MDPNHMTHQALAVATTLILVAGCGEVQPTPTNTPRPIVATDAPMPATATQEPAVSPTPEELEVDVVRDIEYLGSRRLDVWAPISGNEWPVVVLFHGGGATKGDVQNLAQAVSEHGAVVYNVTWLERGEASEFEVDWLSAAEAGACSVRFARATAAEYGGDGSRLTVVGHSAGGSIGALISLGGDNFSGDCDLIGESALPMAFVGIDGDYTFQMGSGTFADFLREENPELWDAINPYTYLGSNPGLIVRLVAGTGAPQVTGRPVPTAEEFEQAVIQHGYDVELLVLDVGHSMIVAPGLPGGAQTLEVIVEVISR